jgi:hypothetical protein
VKFWVLTHSSWDGLAGCHFNSRLSTNLEGYAGGFLMVLIWVCGTQLPLEAYNIELCEHSW